MAFDFLFIYFAKRITEYFNKNPRVIFLYALNPLSMMEITGNLHLEGVMIALFAGSIYFLIKKQYVIAGALLSLSVGTKLLSLLVLPLLVIFIWRKYNPPKRYKPLIMLLASFVLVLSIQLLPFFSWSFINNFSESVGLWFGKFEFNASIFYIVRWVGYQVYGYNIIQSYGFYMPMLSIAFFILIMLRMKASIISVLESFLWMLTFYFLLSTTIHPWYILFPLALSVFTKFRYGMLWSFLVFLSYHAYSSEEFHEIYAIIFLEYAVLITVMLYEFRDRILSFRFSRKPKP
jgi:Gpi18-like mannosyltransferase